jgi:isopentenyldiphosphate isomerase
VLRPDETFDVVNDRDEVIGQATRREVHERGLKHRAVHVLLFSPRSELFVQKRSATKDTFPGRYDSSASGHLDSSETYDACAARELREELGLEVPPTELVRRFKIDACLETGWEFVWVYILRGDYRPRIDPTEIELGDFWGLDRVRETIARHPEQFAPSFCRIIGEADRRGVFR